MDKVTALHSGISEDHIALSRAWFVKPQLETTDTTGRNLVSRGADPIASLVLCSLPEESCQRHVWYHHQPGMQQVSGSEQHRAPASPSKALGFLYPFQDWAWGLRFMTKQTDERKVGAALRNVRFLKPSFMDVVRITPLPESES